MDKVAEQFSQVCRCFATPGPETVEAKQWEESNPQQQVQETGVDAEGMTVSHVCEEKEEQKKPSDDY